LWLFVFPSEILKSQYQYGKGKRKRWRRNALVRGWIELSGQRCAIQDDAGMPLLQY